MQQALFPPKGRSPVVKPLLLVKTGIAEVELNSLNTSECWYKEQ